VKRPYYFAHKSMVEVTKKGSKILVEFIDQINATSIMLEEKGMEIQNRFVEK